MLCEEVCYAYADVHRSFLTSLLPNDKYADVCYADADVCYADADVCYADALAGKRHLKYTERDLACRNRATSV